ncbi:MAG: triose-phosphate isomerase [Bacillota bacterium]|jgi:triosephosphate isomerase|nr:triose-phosphate isomerase [Candidatus Fermentithermobacillaceae bacterium]
MRKPLIAANWKMNKTIGEALTFAGAFGQMLFERFEGGDMPVDVLICPPFLGIPALCAVFAGKDVHIGAQDMYWKDKGAFTGEVSPSMLKDAGCTFVITGHSERRQLFGETDEDVSEKARAALDHGLKPVICVGETLEEREQGKTNQVVSDMIRAAFSKIKAEEVPSVVVAYEPVWAIGTGKEAHPADAAEVIGSIRETVDALFGEGVSDELRVLYGGSVKPGNIRAFMLEEQIDGALVGGASLDPNDFFKLVEAAHKARS